MIEAGARSRWRRGRGRAQLAGGLLIAALVGVGAGIAVRKLSAGSATRPAVQAHFGLHGAAVWAEGARPAPAIDTLRDQTGRPFSLASLRGRSIAIVFFDSHCRQECPLEGRELAAAEASLPAAQRPVLVAVSVNPLDTPASTASAVRAWGLAREAPWHWLMGTRKQLAPVWAAYRIYVSPRPINGDIAHTEALYLVDRRGDERSAYIWPFAGRFVTMDLRTLFRGRST
jgi:cytochrome oxidase Cu insertion factor (SCO1/SenC/PrrC family)